MMVHRIVDLLGNREARQKKLKVLRQKRRRIIESLEEVDAEIEETSKTQFGECGVVNSKTAAAIAGVSLKTIYRWCDDRKIRWMRHDNGDRGIDRNDIEKFAKK